MADEPNETTPAPEEPALDTQGPEAESDDLTPAEESASSGQAGGPVAIGQGKLSESEDRTFGMLAHLLGPLTLIGPLIIWLVKREESPFVDDQGKEAVNFQITMVIGFVIAGVLGMVPIVQCVSFLLLPAIYLVDLIFGILGCVEANRGKVYRYPFNIRLVS